MGIDTVFVGEVVVAIYASEPWSFHGILPLLAPTGLQIKFFALVDDSVGYGFNSFVNVDQLQDPLGLHHCSMWH